MAEKRVISNSLQHKIDRILREGHNHFSLPVWIDTLPFESNDGVPDDRDPFLIRAYRDYCRMMSTSKVAIYLDEQNIGYSREKLRPAIITNLPLHIIQEFAEHHEWYNIRRIDYYSF